MKIDYNNRFKTLDSLLKNAINEQKREYTYTYPPKRAYNEINDPDEFVRQAWEGYEEGAVALYAHIPYCPPRQIPQPLLQKPNIKSDELQEIWGKESCGFCNLFGIPVYGNDWKEQISDYMNTLSDEILLYEEIFGQNHEIASIYFGGGTPSLGSPEDFTKVFESIRDIFGEIPEDIEISLEASPETIKSFDEMKDYRDIGFNRISFGIQSFNLDEITMIGRPAQRSYLKTSKDVVTWAKQAGFKNINIDLIMGLPLQTKENFNSSLAQAIDLDPDTITLYSIAMRGETGFGRCVSHNLIQPHSPQFIAELYDSARTLLEDEGYKQKTSTQWIKQETGGYKQQENMYNMIPELGVGAGARTAALNAHYSIDYAVSYEESKKIIDQWNQKIKNRDFPATHGFILDKDEKKRKRIILQLLSPNGLNSENYQKEFENHPNDDFPEEFAAIGINELIEEGEGFIYFNEKGIQYSSVATRLFWSERVEQAVSEYKTK
ncbi:radical SAM protein [Candidatus Woesearchaeota archaeon]|nr:radical SAM protein [Candidatus Woesearchaeota archaeon]